LPQQGKTDDFSHYSLLVNFVFGPLFKVLFFAGVVETISPDKIKKRPVQFVRAFLYQNGLPVV
jgi:hypothetical protein